MAKKKKRSTQNCIYKIVLFTKYKNKDQKKTLNRSVLNSDVLSFSLFFFSGNILH